MSWRTPLPPHGARVRGELRKLGLTTTQSGGYWVLGCGGVGVLCLRRQPLVCAVSRLATVTAMEV